MKKLILIVPFILLLTSCSLFKTDLEKHEKTLSEYDTYSMITTLHYDQGEGEEEIVSYHFVDQVNDVSCTTSDELEEDGLIGDVDAVDVSDTCRDFFGEIDGIKYGVFSDASDEFKAYPYELDYTIESLLFDLFEEEEISEESGNTIYQTSIAFEDLPFDIQEMLGVPRITDLDILSVVVTMEYNGDTRMFTEITIDYTEIVNAYIDRVNPSANDYSIYKLAITYGDFNKAFKVSLPETYVIDDYVDSKRVGLINGFITFTEQSSFTGTIDDKNDTDIIRFDLENYQLVSLRLDDASQGVDLYYSIFDQNLTYINQGSLTTSDAQSDKFNLSKGVYFIYIYTLGSDATDLDYEMTLRVEEVPAK
jgi:hypothetical protein